MYSLILTSATATRIITQNRGRDQVDPGPVKCSLETEYENSESYGAKKAGPLTQYFWPGLALVSSERSLLVLIQGKLNAIRWLMGLLGVIIESMAYVKVVRKARVNQKVINSYSLIDQNEIGDLSSFAVYGRWNRGRRKDECEYYCSSPDQACGTMDKPGPPSYTIAARDWVLIKWCIWAA